MFEPARLPAPDEMGFFYHPDLPDTGEDESIVPPLEAMGFEVAFIAMDYDAPEEVTDAWYEQEDMTAPSRWRPTPPTGDGWLLAAKYDTEDGPYAMFVTPNAEVTGRPLADGPVDRRVRRHGENDETLD